jgi:hypothetical protein
MRSVCTHFWKVQHVAGRVPRRNWRDSSAIVERVKDISSLTRVHKRSILLSESHGIVQLPVPPKPEQPTRMHAFGKMVKFKQLLMKRVGSNKQAL